MIKIPALPFFRKSNSRKDKAPGDSDTDTDTPQEPDFHVVYHPRDLYLRPAEIADIQFIMKLERAPENARFVGHWSFMQHSQNIFSDNFYYFVIESEHEFAPLGFMIFKTHDDDPGLIQLQRMVIDTKARGIGEHFMRFALEKLRKDTPFEKIILYVRDIDDPQQPTAFWKKLGFQRDDNRALRRSKHILLSRCVSDGTKQDISG